MYSETGWSHWEALSLTSSSDPINTYNHIHHTNINTYNRHTKNETNCNDKRLKNAKYHCKTKHQDHQLWRVQSEIGTKCLSQIRVRSRVGGPVSSMCVWLFPFYYFNESIWNSVIVVHQLFDSMTLWRIYRRNCKKSYFYIWMNMYEVNRVESTWCVVEALFNPRSCKQQWNHKN